MDYGFGLVPKLSFNMSQLTIWIKQIAFWWRCGFE